MDGDSDCRICRYYIGDLIYIFLLRSNLRVYDNAVSVNTAEAIRGDRARALNGFFLTPPRTMIRIWHWHDVRCQSKPLAHVCASCRSYHTFSRDAINPIPPSTRRVTRNRAPATLSSASFQSVSVTAE